MSWRYEEYESDIISSILPQYPIIPPFKSLILRNTNLSSFLSHHSSDRLSIDVLYHENSKVFPGRNSFSSMQRFYNSLKSFLNKDMTKNIQAFYESDGIYKSINSLKEPEKEILKIIKERLPIFLGFYCILKDERLSLFKFERPDYLFLIKALTFDIMEFLRQNLYIFQHDELMPLSLKEPTMILFLYVNHTIIRNSFGVRGYRVALVECGKYMQTIEDKINQLKLNSYSTSVFYDTPLNRFLNLDGRGFSVHGVIVIGG